jgi:DNA repair protein RadC
MENKKTIEELTKRDLVNLLWMKEKEQPSIKVKFPSDLWTTYQKYTKKRKEHFFVTTLTGSHEIIKTRVISIGIANQTIVHPREVFRDAIIDNAVAIIIGHNHPSQNLEPSEEDKQITKRLKDAGEILGIRVLDHMIVTKKGFYSFLEKGVL